MNNKIIVAIDGYSSCGKSTIAKALAKHAGYTYVDTGAMYRAVALYASRLLGDEAIRPEAVISLLANIPRATSLIKYRYLLTLIVF
jgi:cytidylate kinase